MAEVRSPDTRERILDAAERLFMAHGYEGTSMRQITGEAGVNLAAVNYHLGSKEALVQEVFRRRLDWLNDERMRVLNAMEAEADGKPLKPSQIVDGFFGTLLRMADDERRGGNQLLQMVAIILDFGLHGLGVGNVGDKTVPGHVAGGIGFGVRYGIDQQPLGRAMLGADAVFDPPWQMRSGVGRGKTPDR